MIWQAVWIPLACLAGVVVAGGTGWFAHYLATGAMPEDCRRPTRDARRNRRSPRRHNGRAL